MAKIVQDINELPLEVWNAIQCPIDAELGEVTCDCGAPWEFNYTDLMRETIEMLNEAGWIVAKIDSNDVVVSGDAWKILKGKMQHV